MHGGVGDVAPTYGPHGGDGFIGRDEAQANPALADEFDSLDTARRGKLAREQLAGWL